MAKYRVIIGRSEQVDLVGIALNIPAKIDTGAYRSAIHAGSIKEKETNGKKVLTFELLGHPTAPVKRQVQSDQYSKVKVRSSNGQEEDRFEVQLKIKLAGRIFTSSFSLSDRSENFYPVLIGRTAMSRRFMIDPDKNGINREKLLKDYGIKPSDIEEEISYL